MGELHFWLSCGPSCPGCPLCPRGMGRGAGVGFTAPCSGLRRGQATLPAHTPSRRDPREVAAHPRGDGAPAATAPRARPGPAAPEYTDPNSAGITRGSSRLLSVKR